MQIRSTLLALSVLVLAVSAVVVEESGSLETSGGEEYITPHYNHDHHHHRHHEKPVEWIHSAASGPVAEARLRALAEPREPYNPCHHHPDSHRCEEYHRLRREERRRHEESINTGLIHPIHIAKIHRKHFNDEHDLVLPVEVGKNHTHFRDLHLRAGSYRVPYSHRPVMIKSGSIPAIRYANRPTPHITSIARPSPADFAPSRKVAAGTPAAAASRAAAPAAASAPVAAAPAAASTPASSNSPAPMTAYQQAVYAWEQRMRRLFGPNWRSKLANARK